MKEPRANRKRLRLPDFDYRATGAYFVTICTKGRRCLLWGEAAGADAVGDDAHIVPPDRLSDYGRVCDQYIHSMSVVYTGVSVDHYVIMPNHIHLLIRLDGAMWASPPTGIESIVRSFKTLVSKEIGVSVWQRSFYDHIIRNQEDYDQIAEYIMTNPMRWQMDSLYAEE